MFFHDFLSPWFSKQNEHFNKLGETGRENENKIRKINLLAYFSGGQIMRERKQEQIVKTVFTELRIEMRFKTLELYKRVNF